MALSPYILGELLQELAYPHGFYPGLIYDQNFGLGVVPGDLIHPSVNTPLLASYIRPWRIHSSRNRGLTRVHSSQDGLKLNLDVQQFKPDEISVKMLDGNIVVEGRHDERQDEHGFISCEFKRRYRVPDDVDVDALVSELSSDGVLSIKAPKKIMAPPSKERVIKIICTNTPAVTSKVPADSEKKATENKESGDKVDE